MPNPISAGPAGGLMAPLKAVSYLMRRPRLWWLAVTPFLVNLGLFIVFFWFSYTRFESWVGRFLPTGEGWWWQALFYLMLVLVVGLLLALEVYLFAVIGRIIAAPFLEALTHQVELEHLGDAAPPGPGVWQGLWRVMGQELKKLVLFLGLLATLFVLNLIPGLGSAIFSALAWLLTCYFMALEFLDWPLERRKLSLGEKMAYILRMRLTSITFGTACIAIGLIPVINLALLPLAAVGGTLLYLKREEGE